MRPGHDLRPGDDLAEIQNRQIIIKKSPFTKQRATGAGKFCEVQAA
jgi:hypothetical protein